MAPQADTIVGNDAALLPRTAGALGMVPHHPRRVIFSASLEIHTAALPRLKPYIPLDPEMLALLSEDEEDGYSLPC